MSEIDINERLYRQYYEYHDKRRFPGVTFLIACKYDNEIKRVKDAYASVNSLRHLHIVKWRVVHFREYLVKSLC